MSGVMLEPTETRRAPSFEDACKTHQQVLFTHDALRLYWTLNGPLTDAISVMDDRWFDSGAPLEQYCIQTEPSLNWAPIAQFPLTEPKISSVTVIIQPLYEWEDQWMALHEEHPIPGVHDEDDTNDTKFGLLTDYDSESDEEGPEHLLRCCGGDRPRKTKVSLTINAEGEFLTVHEYVSAIHPWLMGLRDKILQASGDLESNIALPSDTRLMVGCHTSPDYLIIIEEEEWKQDKSKKENLKSMQEMEAWKNQRAIEDQDLVEERQAW